MASLSTSVAPPIMVGRAGAIVPPVTYLTYNERQPSAQLPSCSEPPPDPINEAELSLLWQGQRFPGEALRTVDGRAVRVVYPGRRGAGPGPDFRDAVVFVGDEERRGDVELHVRASAFRGHGHNADAAYDGVALHVVYLADERPVKPALKRASPRWRGRPGCSAPRRRSGGRCSTRSASAATGRCFGP